MKVRLVIVLVCSLFAANADAQDKGRIGVTTGYPGAIGVQWHVADRIAVRPDITFSKADSSSNGIVDATTDFWSLGTGVSVLFFSTVTDNLRTYVAPRFSFARTHGSGDVSNSTTDSYSIAGMFGAHYLLGQRFAVFGELGFGYTRQTGSATTTIVNEVRTTNHGNSVATRTGIGVILYF
jgi:hypothetical protein